MIEKKQMLLFIITLILWSFIFSNSYIYSPPFITLKNASYSKTAFAFVPNNTITTPQPEPLAQKVNETAPIANAGVDQTVYAASIVTLDGSKSFDRDGDPIIKYQWNSCYGYALFVGPTGETTCNAEGETVTVQVPNVEQPTDFQANLIVSDGKFSSNPPDVVVLHALPLQQK